MEDGGRKLEDIADTKDRFMFHPDPARWVQAWCGPLVNDSFKNLVADLGTELCCWFAMSTNDLTPLIPELNVLLVHLLALIDKAFEILTLCRQALHQAVALNGYSRQTGLIRKVAV